ncbi:hypothetical protein ACFLXQ_07665, partial [Chloroflexota bacterium]
ANPILPAYALGSWVSHHPFYAWSIQDVIPFGHNYTLAEVRNGPLDVPPGMGPNDVPSLEYDFITKSDWEGSSDDDTRIWARVQGGGAWWDSTTQNIYWAVYEYSDLYGAAGGDPTLATPLGSTNIEEIDQTPGGGANYAAADGNQWIWRELTNNGTSLNLDEGKRYTLKIWAGRVGFDIDQIVIGNRNNTSFTSDYNGGVIRSGWDATEGSAFRQACNRCNPIYGLTVDQADCVSPIDNGANTVPQDGYDLSAPPK